MRRAKLLHPRSEIRVFGCVAASGEVAKIDQMQHRLIVILREPCDDEPIHVGPQSRFLTREPVESVRAGKGGFALATGLLLRGLERGGSLPLRRSLFRGLPQGANRTSQMGS